MMSITSNMLHPTPFTGWNGVTKLSWPMQDRCCEQAVRSCPGIATECSRGESASFCWQPEVTNLSRVVSALHSSRHYKQRHVGRQSIHLRSPLDPLTNANSCLNHRPHTRLVVSGCNNTHRRPTALATEIPVELEQFSDEQDFFKAGGGDLRLVQLQASKCMDQPKIADKLRRLVPGERILDLVVIGCGPAGLSLAAESARQGLEVGLIGPDVPFVNNYGVWYDEFKALGLAGCIDHIWRDASIYLEEEGAVMVGRAYGRVSRGLLRDELLKRCSEAGVSYLDCEVRSTIDVHCGSTVLCSDGSRVECRYQAPLHLKPHIQRPQGALVLIRVQRGGWATRLVSVAAGAAAGKLLEYEEGSAGVGVQTAYGIEVEVAGYPYDPTVMHFMDYRHWEGPGEKQPHPEEGEFEHIPSFLYAMPLSSTRVFFEETCLAARPAMPLELLRKRLAVRLTTLGLQYTTMHEQEWSYIPVGGALPCTRQRHIAFGAAASMIHPATGYSISRSLTEAPQQARAISEALRGAKEGGGSEAPDCEVAAVEAWSNLWSRERKRQRAFMIFGLELILQLDLQATREFFQTFFRLPEWLWRGFLGSTLSSTHLMWFAFVTFVVAPNSLRFRLMQHLVKDPSGASLVKTYLGWDSESKSVRRQFEAVAMQGLLFNSALGETKRES